MAAEQQRERMMTSAGDKVQGVKPPRGEERSDREEAGGVASHGVAPLRGVRASGAEPNNVLSRERRLMEGG